LIPPSPNLSATKVPTATPFICRFTNAVPKARIGAFGQNSTSARPDEAGLFPEFE
jgi:hypothetical protein